jgi:hypothetical protein
LTINQPIVVGYSLMLEIKDKNGKSYKYMGPMYNIIGNYVVQLSAKDYFGGSVGFLPVLDYRMKEGETYKVTGNLYAGQGQGEIPVETFKGIYMHSNTIEIKIP